MLSRTDYVVQFDVTYLDGALAGLAIAGETVTYPDRSSANRGMAFYSKVAREQDFIRACGTGNRYRVSNVRMFAP